MSNWALLRRSPQRMHCGARTGSNLGQAFLADGNSGNIVERSTAESAIRGKEDRKNALQEGFEGRKNHSALPGARVSSFSF